MFINMLASVAVPRPPQHKDSRTERMRIDCRKISNFRYIFSNFIKIFLKTFKISFKNFKILFSWPKFSQIFLNLFKFVKIFSNFLNFV